MLSDSFPRTVARSDFPVWIFKRNFNILCIWKGRSNRRNLGEAFHRLPFQFFFVSPTLLQQIMLLWLSRTHGMSGFLSFVQNLYPTVDVLLPKDMAVSSEESQDAICICLYSIFLLIWGPGRESTPAGVFAFCLGAGGRLPNPEIRDQVKILVRASWSFLKNPCEVCPSVHAVHTALCSLWYRLAFVPPARLRLHCVLLLPKEPPQTERSGWRVPISGLLSVASPQQSWRSGRRWWLRARSSRGVNGSPWCLRRAGLGVSTAITFILLSFAKASYMAKPNFRGWILHLPKRWEDEKWKLAEGLSV